MKINNKINMFGWCLFILFVGTGLYVSLLNVRIDRLEHPVTPTMVASNYVDSNGRLISAVNVESALLSDGWSLECSQFVNVSNYKFIDEVNDNCRDVCMTSNGCKSIHSPNDFCHNEDDCNSHCYFRNNLSLIVPAHVVYFNESVCVKQVLVKNIKGDLNE